MSSITLAFLFLLTGLLTGGLCGWLIAKVKYRSLSLSDGQLQERYVPKELFQNIENQLYAVKKKLTEREEDLLTLEKMMATKERDILYLEEKLGQWKEDFEVLHKRAHTEFENIANKIFEEKTQKFTNQNQKQLNDLLQPLKDNIRDFGKDIERRFTDEAKDKVSLKKELDYLKELNQQLSTDAQLLAAALKGDSKVQGDWGELQLEILLEKAGLQKDTHYRVQPSFKDENGLDKRPDFIIQLPENKHLIVDSKVSLKAYEKFFHASDEQKRKKYLKAHMESIRSHIRDLNSKKYQHLYQINTPDYLLLFIPVEPAFNAAMQQDSRLFLEALDKNIVLVTTSTLLATMRTVSYIWRQESQKKNVLEIARQSGLLYDKFVAFTADLQEIGQRLQHAQNAWHGAMNKMSDSKKFRDTLIGRAEYIKKLGAKASKALPEELLETGEE